MSEENPTPEINRYVNAIDELRARLAQADALIERVYKNVISTSISYRGVERETMRCSSCGAVAYVDCFKHRKDCLVVEVEAYLASRERKKGTDMKTSQMIALLKALDQGEDSEEISVETNPMEGDYGVQIVVLDRGFVYVGEVEISDGFVNISKAKNIRAWGTTSGLGQLALEGPQSATCLDNVGVVKCPLRALISLIAVKNAKKWSF